MTPSSSAPASVHSPRPDCSHAQPERASSSSNNTPPPAALPTHSVGWALPGMSGCTTWETWNPDRAHDNSWTTSPTAPSRGTACPQATTASTCPATASTSQFPPAPTSINASSPHYSPTKRKPFAATAGTSHAPIPGCHCTTPARWCPRAPPPPSASPNARSQATRSSGRSTTWNADSATPRFAPS